MSEQGHRLRAQRVGRPAADDGRRPHNAIVYRVLATTIDAGTGASPYYVYLSSDTPTGAPQTVAELNFGNATAEDAAITKHVFPATAVRTVDANEQFFVQFNPGPDVAALCMVQITYYMPD